MRILRVKKIHTVLFVSTTLIVGMVARDFGWLEWPDAREAHQKYARNNAKSSNEGPAQATLKTTNVSPNHASGDNHEPDQEDTDSKELFEESKKDRLDIYAQEGMWRAANWLVYFALVTAVTTIFTCILLLLTFGATKETLKQARVTARLTNKTLKEAKDTTIEARRSADAAEKAEKAHVLPIMEARFADVEYTGSGARPLHTRPDKSTVRITISVGNFGKTPVRGGRINHRKLVGGSNEEVSSPFKALAAGDTIQGIAEMDVYVSELIGETARTTYEIFTSTVFTDVDGDKSPILVAWGDVRLMNNERPVSYDQLRDMSVPERLKAYDDVRVEVTYVDMPGRQANQGGGDQV